MFDDICFLNFMFNWTNILISYFSLKDLVNQNASLKEQLDKAISEKKLIEKTTSTELEPKLEVIWSGFNENFHHISNKHFKIVLTK